MPQDGAGTAQLEAEYLSEIEERVRKTICRTYSSTGRESVEGRVSAADFEALIIFARRGVSHG